MKKRKMGLLAVAALAVTTMTMGEAKAFCIYNYSSWPIYFEQLKSLHGEFLRAGMAGVIPAKGGKQCCNWQNKDCNPTGLKMASVYFRHHVSNPPDQKVHNFRCNEQWLPLQLQAGGWAEIYDNPSSGWGISCVTYPAN